MHPRGCPPIAESLGASLFDSTALLLLGICCWVNLLACASYRTRWSWRIGTAAASLAGLSRHTVLAGQAMIGAIFGGLIWNLGRRGFSKIRHLCSPWNECGGSPPEDCIQSLLTRLSTQRITFSRGKEEDARPLTAEELDFARALAESDATAARANLKEHESGLRPRSEWEAEALRCAAAVNPSISPRRGWCRLGCWPMLTVITLFLLLSMSGHQSIKPDVLPLNSSAANERVTSLAELSLAEGPATCVGEAAAQGPKKVPVPPLATSLELLHYF